MQQVTGLQYKIIIISNLHTNSVVHIKVNQEQDRTPQEELHSTQRKLH